MLYRALIATVVVSAVLGYRAGDAAPQAATGTVLQSGGFQLLETTIDEQGTRRRELAEGDSFSSTSSIGAR